jgi:hypothetical protein
MSRGYYDTKDLSKDLVGRTIQKISMSHEYLRFDTSGGTFVYTVEGDCCSYSYFYDFHGVKKLLAGNPVVSARAVDLADPTDEDAKNGDEVVAYGFEIVTNDPEFGEVTSVFSFRNDSSGYYGGWMSYTEARPQGLKELADDELGLAR